MDKIEELKTGLASVGAKKGRSLIVCPECAANCHSRCVEQGCECECVLFEELEDEDFSDDIPCPKCLGSGLTIEGWDCWYCDGDGYLEF
jgi:hypothetical protein